MRQTGRKFIDIRHAPDRLAFPHLPSPDCECPRHVLMRFIIAARPHALRRRKPGYVSAHRQIAVLAVFITRLLSPLQRSRGSGLQRCDNQRRRLNLLCPAVRADPLSRPDSLEAPSVALTVTPIICCVSSCIAFSRHRASNITLCISANHFISYINVHNSAALASMALDPVATLRDIC